MFVTDAGSNTIYAYEDASGSTTGGSSTGTALVQLDSPRTVCLRTKK